MCYAYLDEAAPSGTACRDAECGSENDRNAMFCMHCGTALDDGEGAAPAIPDSLALAFVILDAAEGTTGTDDERVGPSDDEEPEMDDDQAAAFEAFKAEQTALGDRDAAEPSEDDLDEEEFAPPSALTLEQEALGVSEPQEQFEEVSEEELVPPPPMDIDEVEDERPTLAMGDLSLEPSEPSEPAQPPPAHDIAAVPQVPDEITEDDLVPPVPQDLLAHDDAEPQPEQPPAVSGEQQPEADKPETADAGQEEAEGLGGWSLDFDDQDREDDK